MTRTLTSTFAALACTLFAAHDVHAGSIKHVFVIAMENKDATDIYGNSALAPYINNTLIPNYARATNFLDPLPKLDSEPHYLWMEAGTNKFKDHTFTTDADASATNSTASRDHLSTQIEQTGTVTWMTYQEDANSGQCPITSGFPYMAKHNPFIFFQDVSGSPPSRENEFCKKHTRSYAKFATDLAANQMANYVFITPNLCHDMHGDERCPPGDAVTAGDTWLATELPRMIDWAGNNSGVIFIVWDEGALKNQQIPFLAVGPGVKPGFASSIKYDHGSLVRSVEEIFGLPFLKAVSAKNSLIDMFKQGSFP